MSRARKAKARVCSDSAERDTGEVQVAGAREEGVGLGRGAEPGPRRSLAVVDDLGVAAVGAALQRETGQRLGVDADHGGVHAAGGELRDGEAAEGLGADPPDPADPVAEPGETDGDVRLRAGEREREAGDPLERSGLTRHEHRHDLAEGDDVEPGGGAGRGVRGGCRGGRGCGGQRGPGRGPGGAGHESSLSWSADRPRSRTAPVRLPTGRRPATRWTLARRAPAGSAPSCRARTPRRARRAPPGAPAWRDRRAADGPSSAGGRRGSRSRCRRSRRPRRPRPPSGRARGCRCTRRGPSCR